MSRRCVRSFKVLIDDVPEEIVSCLRASIYPKIDMLNRRNLSNGRKSCQAIHHIVSKCIAHYFNSITWTGLAATSRPAIPPPTTRPSGLAKETLIPPDLLFVPPFSVGMNEPDRESNWKWPYKKSLCHFVDWQLTIIISIQEHKSTFSILKTQLYLSICYLA